MPHTAWTTWPARAGRGCSDMDAMGTDNRARRGELAAWHGAGRAQATILGMSETPTTPPQEGAGLFRERDRIERLSRVRDLVFGSLDGLIVPLGVVSGV